MSPLSEADQQLLLRLARRGLEESVRRHRLPEVNELSDGARADRGAFVTLRKAAQLRGCIGVVEALQPLYRTVIECAVSAALHDPRFPPVTPDELPELRTEISVLSPLAQVSPDQIEVGRHGLMISQGPKRGVLLPQVAVEWHWDSARFLEETCRKACLPADAWRRGARIEAFTVQAFGEPLENLRVSLRVADANLGSHT